MRIVPLAAWLQPGDTLRLAAVPLDAAGAPIAHPPAVVWRSGAPLVARVDRAGLVTAMSAGDVDVFAAIGSIEGSSTIHVIPDAAAFPRFLGVTAGDDFTCGLDAIGAVLCWGLNAHGQLGSVGSETGASPVPVTALAGVRRVTAGTRHACAVDADGRPWCWGWNSVRQAGPDLAGKIADAPHPLPLPGRYLELAAGSGHTCALRDDGAVLCWGSGALGQTGAGPQPVTGVTLVENVPPLASLTAGHAHTCGLDERGTAWCWGWNEFGQLGAATGACQPPSPCSATPVAVRFPRALTMLAAGSGFTCGLDVQGQTHCWGANASGQLGNGPGPASVEPIRVDAVPAFVALEAGREHACGATRQGPVFCWGANERGQLGDGTTAMRDRPVRAASAPEPASALAAGGAHTCALAEDGRILCWGANAAGQLGLFPSAH